MDFVLPICHHMLPKENSRAYALENIFLFCTYNFEVFDVQVPGTLIYLFWFHSYFCWDAHFLHPSCSFFAFFFCSKQRIQIQKKDYKKECPNKRLNLPVLTELYTAFKIL